MQHFAKLTRVLSRTHNSLAQQRQRFASSAATTTTTTPTSTTTTDPLPTATARTTHLNDHDYHHKTSKLTHTLPTAPTGSIIPLIDLQQKFSSASTKPSSFVLADSSASTYPSSFVHVKRQLNELQHARRNAGFKVRAHNNEKVEKHYEKVQKLAQLQAQSNNESLPKKTLAERAATHLSQQQLSQQQLLQQQLSQQQQQQRLVVFDDCKAACKLRAENGTLEAKGHHHECKHNTITTSTSTSNKNTKNTKTASQHKEINQLELDKHIAPTTARNKRRKAQSQHQARMQLALQHQAKRVLAAVNHAFSTESVVQPRNILLSMRAVQSCEDILSASELASFVESTILSQIPPSQQPLRLHNMQLHYLCSIDISDGLKYLENMEDANHPTPEANLTTYEIVIEQLLYKERHQDVIDLVSKIYHFHEHNDSMNDCQMNEKKAWFHIRTMSMTSCNALDASLTTQHSPSGIILTMPIEQHQQFNDDIALLQPDDYEGAWELLEERAGVDISMLRNLLQHQLCHIPAPQRQMNARSIFQKSGGKVRLLDKLQYKDVAHSLPWWSTQVDKTLDYLHKRTSLRMNTDTVNLLLKGAALSRDKATARRLWRDVICAHDVRTDSKVGAAPINDDTRNIPPYAVLPNSLTRHHIVNTVLQSHGSSKELQTVWSTMQEVQPLMLTVNSVLKQVQLLQGVLGALEFLNTQMQLYENLTPTLWTLNLLLKGCAKEGQVGASFSLLEGAARTWNITPTVVSYTIIMQCYRTKQDPVGAYAVFQRMLKEHIVPDRVACTRMMQLFAEYGDEEACINFLKSARKNRWLKKRARAEIEEMAMEIFARYGDSQLDHQDQQQYDEYEKSGYQNLLVALPKMSLLTTSTSDDWLLEEIAALTPGTDQARSILEERSRLSEEERTKELRVLIEKGSIRAMVTCRNDEEEGTQTRRRRRRW